MKCAQQHEVVLTYPPATVGSIAITTDDLRRLEPSQYLNDKIIDFGLQFWRLEFEKSHPDLADGVYIFNTFFIQKLKDHGYDGVRRWTEKTDVFEKRYLIIPCHDKDNFHWYLTIIYEPRYTLGDAGAETHSSDLGSAKADLMGSSQNNDIRHHASHIKEDKPDFEREVITGLPQKFYFGVKSDEVTEYLETMCGIVPNIEACFIDKRELLFLQTAPDDEMQVYDARTSITLAGGNSVPLNQHISPISSESNKHRSTPCGNTIVKGADTDDYNGLDEEDHRTWIFVFDSLGHRHCDTASLVKDFLYEEAKIKKGIQDPVEAFDKTTCPLHQKNGFDCGLFLLHYVNTFMTHPKKYAMVTRNQGKYNPEKVEKLWRSDEIQGSREKLKACIACLRKAEDITKDAHPPSDTSRGM